MIMEIISIIFVSSGLGFLAFYYISSIIHEEDITPSPIPFISNRRYLPVMKRFEILDTIDEE
jgi:hypothetical protein